MSTANSSLTFVIVLSWFGKSDTLRCLRSLREEPSDLGLIVVDNGSFDGLLEEVAEEFPDAITIQTGDNLGFAGGMNVGIRRALDEGASYITALNNDTVASSSAILNLEAACGDEWALSPEVAYLDDPDTLWFGGGAINPATNRPYHVATDELLPGDGIRLSPVLAGCCVTASAATWRKVGLFDERFFLNFEDSEWSVRARRRGVKLGVDTRVHILHAVSKSFERAPAYIGDYYFARNGLLFNRIVGGGVKTGATFLRRDVLPALKSWFTDVGVGAGLRSLMVLAAATTHAVVGRFGRAPRWIERARATARRDT